MKKSVLTGFMAIAALTVYAEEPTYNLFDPADCDEEGWLWLNTPEKIAKYVGPNKKIQLVDAPYEIEDPDFPGETIIPETVADPNVLGYNTEGVEGGEGCKTGGIIFPTAVEDDWGWFVLTTEGGGILIQMPDCATFDVYMSSSLPKIYTYQAGAKEFTDLGGCKYIWNDGEPTEDNPDDGPIISTYEGAGLNLQRRFTDYSGTGGQGSDEEIFSYYGPKGQPRTAYFANYTYAPCILHGIRIKTYTDVSMLDTSVEDMLADAAININGKSIVLSAPAEISVYNAAGVKVAGTYGECLDCSDLNGLYIVKSGNKAIKAKF